MTKDTAAPKAKAAAQAAEVQAEGLSVYRVFWLFLMASFLGDLIEVVFWLVTRGELISRSSLVYGPFSLVWGFGAVLLTLVFHKLQDQGNIQIFLLGTALGGVYEYICSWFQEWAFGVCFWDYSHLPFNLNGRINLVFCLFWGAVAVLWVRLVYPGLCRLISAIPRRVGKKLAAVMAVFLAVSTVLSAAALYREATIVALFGPPSVNTWMSTSRTAVSRPGIPTWASWTNEGRAPWRIFWMV